MNISTTKAPLDWIAGKETGVHYTRSVPAWETFLAPGESQKTLNMDTDECTIYSGTHSIVAQINYDIIKGNYSSEAIDFFHAAGYMADGSFNVSELFNAKLAGTTREGTYMNAMGQSFRVDGLLPQADLPLPPKYTWDQFDALVITDAMKMKAKMILKYIEPEYQWIDGPVTVQHLMLAPVQIAVGVCPVWSVDKPIKACPAPMAHCVVLYDLNAGKHIQDTYVPFLKTLASDYLVYAAMQYLAFPRTEIKTVTKPTGTFTTTLNYADMDSAEVTRVQQFLAWDGEIDVKYVCGVFGPRTLKAIKDFQYKYEYNILVPAGVVEPTGKWGNFTMAQANALLSV